jgi:pyruvate,water dikinase
MMPFVQQTFENAMRVSTMSSLGPGALGAVCAGIGDPTAAIRLLAGIEVDSAAPSHAMWELGRTAAASADVSKAFDTAGADGVLDALRASGSADAKAFLAKFDEFLYEYGSRAQGEYDLYAQAWEVKPRIALTAIDLMRRSDDSHSPASRHAASVAERDSVLADIRGKIAGDAETAGLFEAALGSSRLFLAGRERAKTNCVRVIHEARVALRELGRRLVERGVISEIEQVFMLRDAELDQVRQTPEKFTAVVAERWSVYQGLWDMEPVFVVNGTAPSLAQMTRKGTSTATLQVGSVLQGAAGSGGKASGRARVVLDAADPVGLEPGDVLIAPQTDPSWVPLFVPASAVIVNVGAAGSHAMIVSRELGIPCVVSVADATANIPDGAMVTVDGNAGTVTIDSLP